MCTWTRIRTVREKVSAFIHNSFFCVCRYEAPYKAVVITGVQDNWQARYTLHKLKSLLSAL
jgi:hypothetical protein